MKICLKKPALNFSTSWFLKLIFLAYVLLVPKQHARPCFSLYLSTVRKQQWFWWPSRDLEQSNEITQCENLRVCDVSPGGHNSNESLKSNVALEQVTQRSWRRSKQHKLNIKKQRSEHRLPHMLNFITDKSKKKRKETELFLGHNMRFTFIKMRQFWHELDMNILNLSS